MLKKSLTLKVLALVLLFLFLICSTTLATNAKKDLMGALKKLKNIEHSLQRNEYKTVREEKGFIDMTNYKITNGVISSFDISYAVSPKLDNWNRINVEDIFMMLGVVNKYTDRGYTYILSISYPNDIWPATIHIKFSS